MSFPENTLVKFFSRRTFRKTLISVTSVTLTKKDPPMGGLDRTGKTVLIEESVFSHTFPDMPSKKLPRTVLFPE
jgi:hypothetical protein